MNKTIKTKGLWGSVLLRRVLCLLHQEGAACLKEYTSDSYVHGSISVRLSKLFLRLAEHTNSSRKRRFFRTPACVLACKGNHFGNRAFQKPWRHDNHVISLAKVSSCIILKSPTIVAILGDPGAVSLIGWGRVQTGEKKIRAKVLSFLTFLRPKFFLPEVFLARLDSSLHPN